MLEQPWRIEMFGGLRARQGDRTIQRFQTVKTGALLAYLAYYPNRNHPRELLIDQLWPDVDLDAGRMSLRTALASLRRQFEPPGTPAGSVLVADRVHVRLNPQVFTTDVADFEACLSAAKRADSFEERIGALPERIAALSKAVALYQGELLSGWYEDWVDSERERLADVFLNALDQLVSDYEREGNLEHALDHAHRLVARDRLREESHAALIRLYGRLGRPADALRQYHELERILQEELNESPSPATRRLIAGLDSLRTPRQIPFQHDLVAAPTGPSLSEEPVVFASPGEASERRNPVLPPLHNRFFGRAEEMARLKAMLSPSQEAVRPVRMVTLIGPGGAGKTRLAAEAAHQLTDCFDGRVWFVSLAEILDPHALAGELLNALRIERSPGMEALDQIAAMLNRPLGAPPSGSARHSEEQATISSALLVLDNFEQVAAGGGLLLRDLLSRAPEVRLLVTSRRKLGLQGERQLLLEPLPIPELTDDPQALAEVASVQLYTDRAQAARPDFQVTRGNAHAVAALCRQLEGIPLALELAAARAGALTPAQILERLSERFALLTSRRTDKSARHRSLWVCIEWSYSLLTPELKRLFRQLSVFRGSWSIEAVETICAEPFAVEYIAQLRERSLLSGEEESGDGLRFRILEALREFAAEQLTAEEFAALSGRHLDYYLELAKRAEVQMTGAEARQWLDRLEIEHDNLRAAYEWALQRADERGLRICLALGRFWVGHGHIEEGRERLTRCLQASSQQDPLPRAGALNSAAWFAHVQGDHSESLALYEESLTIYRTLSEKHPDGLAATLSNMGVAVYSSGDYDRATALYEESLFYARKCGQEWRVAGSLNNLGNVFFAQGDIQKAQECYEEALAIRRALGDQSGIASSLSNLGTIVLGQGNLLKANALQQESLALRRELQDKLGIATSLVNLGDVQLRMGDLALARETLTESLQLWQEMGHRLGLSYSLDAMAGVLVEEKEFRVAASLMGAATQLRKAIQADIHPSEQAHNDRLAARLHAALGDSEYTRARDYGATLSPEAAATLLRARPS